MKHNIHPDLMALATPVDDLHQDPANARTDHDIVRLAGSLAQYGQRKPLVVNRSESNKIEAGNGTWQAVKFLGWTHVAAVFVEDSPTTAAAYAIADNRLAELSRWDYEALQTLIDSIDPDLGLETGFAEGELEEMLRAAGIEPLGDAVGEPGDAEPQLDRAEELAAEWGTRPGQMWKLPSRVDGQYHLLACGDCTDMEVVQRLMEGKRATLFAVGQKIMGLAEQFFDVGQVAGKAPVALAGSVKTDGMHAQVAGQFVEKLGDGVGVAVKTLFSSFLSG